MSRFRSVFVLLLLSVCVATGAVATSSTTKKTTYAPAPKSGPAARTFTGTSDKGDFEEALSSAVQSAMESRQGAADAMIEWKLKSVSGVQGGFAGFRKITVTIEAKAR
jgi:hypothetical protein